MATATRSSATSGRSRAARRKAPRKGCETPRIFTPPLRPLTPETTLGFLAILFAEEVCGLTLIPWQRWLLIHMLELAPGLTVETMNDRGPLDPLFRFRRVIILVARQNGKSTLSQVLALFFMYVLGTRMVLGTAQDLDTAEEVWQGAVDLIEEVDEDEEPVRPDLYAELDKVVRRNGKRSLNLIGGARYRVKAANRRAGRGLSAELAMLDELREHLTWEAWAAITKTTNARPSAMIVGLSNAGDSASVVLDFLRKSAHRAIGDPDEICGTDDLEVPDELIHELHDGEAWDGDDEPDEDTLGIFEWSAPPGCDKRDRDGWAQANPSLGYTISERTIAGDCASDPEWVFRTEVLCQWPDGAIHGPFEAGAWEAGTDPASSRASNARVDACVSVSHDRSRAFVTVAAAREDGAVHVEVVAERAGTEWVKPWFLDGTKPERATWRITGQTNGAPVSSLMQELKESGLDVHDWAGPDLGRAHGAFFDAVENQNDDETEWLPRVFHRPQKKLDLAAAQAVTKPLGDGWVFDLRRSPVDVAPLQGAVGAHWLHHRPVDKKAEPRIRRIGARA